jgi:hypothetical protein
MGIQLLKLMKPLTKLSRSKESRKFLKTMLNEPPTEKWDMCRKVNLKKSMESSTFMFN